MSLIIKNIIFFVIRCYKLFLSPLLGVNCRYYPTCSEYLQECINNKGIVKGGHLGLKRLLKCNPWGGYGYDPVDKNKNV
tara:strand:- start:111 stop:347 length:237 start_codon:yes stop_codon:yes gene_type:complete